MHCVTNVLPLFLFSYESTITAQFFGHTHYDEFQIFYDTSDLGRALSIAYVGPSVSPYYDLNPGYRIYYIDGDHPKTTRVSKMILFVLLVRLINYTEFGQSVTFLFPYTGCIFSPTNCFKIVSCKFETLS